ncbi:MAG: threonine synthase [Chitinophagales bacterium]
MNYYSTKNKNLKSTFRNAVIQGLPEDNGLFMPEKIPVLPSGYFSDIQEKTIQQVAFDVLQAFVGDEISSDKLQEIIDKTYSFPFPLVNINDNIFTLELFHGASYAFKDVGATFLALCLDEFYKDSNEKCTILVATSGDTGGAVAAAFSKTKNVEVVILYPSGKVSELQEKQLTTFEKNVTALEIEGDFDDCQALVKEAFLDSELRKQKKISSANSINVARLLPQAVYYFAPFIHFGAERDISISVPSGNYGNLTAGLIAQKMGLPVKQFIAASNSNDVVPRFLASDKFEPRPTIATISNAMDVGKPSNFQRLTDLWDTEELKEKIKAYSYSDTATLKCMQKVYQKKHYLLDPHGAVGYLALQDYLSDKNDIGVVLETAHPCKFMDVVKNITNENIIPASAEPLLKKEKKSIKMKVDYKEFKAFLLS